MVAAANVKKPRVIGIVILTFLSAIFSILGGVGLIALVGTAQTSGADIPGWILPLAYLTVAIGVVDFVGAILLLMYKKLGLYLVTATTVLVVIINVISVVTGNSTISSIAIGTLIDLAILYYLYIYLTREPEKSFFT